MTRPAFWRVGELSGAARCLRSRSAKLLVALRALFPARSAADIHDERPCAAQNQQATDHKAGSP